MTIEAVSNGTDNLVILHKHLPPAPEPKRRDLTPEQISWCERNLKGFCWPKVEKRS